MRSIPFAKPFITSREVKNVVKALKSGWLTTGKVTSDFEKKFSAFANGKFCLAVNSATAGLHLALEAICIKSGDLVALPTNTFAATAEVVRYLGAVPVLVDIENDSPHISVAALRKVVSEKNIKAVMPVHFGGSSCNMSAILELCKSENIFCVEDAAHAFPAQSDDFQLLGTQGDVGVFSFYATKTITTGEGGMIVTSNEELYKRMKLMRLHGINRDVWDRYTNTKASWEYDIVAPGFKYNLTDIASSIGIAQLEIACKMADMRKKIAQKYLDSFATLEAQGLIAMPKNYENHSWHLFSIMVADQGSFEENHNLRNRFISKLNERGIGTSVHFKPLHLMSYYKEIGAYKATDFPNALARYSRTISLPIYPSLTKNELQYIIRQVKDIAING